MLVLTIRRGAAVVLSGGIRIVNIDGAAVRLAFDVPPDVKVLREEVALRDQAKQLQPARLFDPRD